MKTPEKIKHQRLIMSTAFGNFIILNDPYNAEGSKIDARMFNLLYTNAFFCFDIPSEYLKRIKLQDT